MRCRFGECTLDTDSRELVREGKPVRLTGKAFRLLQVLVENRPRALSKDELQDLVWPGVFVSEANLTNLVTELRKAIGDDAHEPAFIRTVYGFGYAFSGDIEDVAAPPRSAQASRGGRFRLVWGLKQIPLADGENVLGRGPESIDWIDRETVSRRHACIIIAGETAIIEDLGSKNGTFVDGRRLTSAFPLADGDEIRLGAVPLTFRALEPASTATGLKRRRRPR